MTSCHDCRSSLIAYVHHELSADRRREIARHLDRCPECYAAYVEERDLAQDLIQIVPRLGEAGAPQFEQVWRALQSQPALDSPAGEVLYPARYGLAALLLILALLFPWSLSRGEIMLAAPPTQPSPVTQTITATPSVARATVMAVALHQTPKAAPHSVPLLSATSTP